MILRPIKGLSLDMGGGAKKYGRKIMRMERVFLVLGSDIILSICQRNWVGEDDKLKTASRLFVYSTFVPK